MKRKTWIVSALMYTLVFLVCFGVLHFFKKITTAIDSTEYTTEAGSDIVIDGTDNDADPDNLKILYKQFAFFFNCFLTKAKTILLTP